MPLKGYGVLKGKAIDAKREDNLSSPHYQVHIVAADTHYRLAVNVKSVATPSELMFLVTTTFSTRSRRISTIFRTGSPRWRAHRAGRRSISSAATCSTTGHADPSRILPGPDNDLSDRLEHYRHARDRDPTPDLHAFGERWGPELDDPDKIFGFLPGNGVHDIHMNQGNDAPVPRRRRRLAGRRADPALPGARPVGRRSSWPSSRRPGTRTTRLATPSPDEPGRPAPSEPTRSGSSARWSTRSGPAPEHETVTLLNASPDAIDLAGWQIADKLKHKHTLSGHDRGRARRWPSRRRRVQLGNSGGLITLLDASGLKVDGVSYTEGAGAARGLDDRVLSRGRRGDHRRCRQRANISPGPGWDGRCPRAR